MPKAPRNAADGRSYRSRENKPASRGRSYGKPERQTAPVSFGAPSPFQDMPQATSFDELGLSEPILRAIQELGFEAPTPIQAQTVPVLLTGRDLIGQAQTGTGKTAAFALPLIHLTDAARRETQALVLAPTRELAVQVAGGIHDLARHTGLRVVPVYGGQPIDRQIRALRAGAQIVVGTPGRILDHLRRGSLALDQVRFCTLDEADEMLALGFLDDVEAILSELPESRQTAFFSATMPPRVAALMRRFLKDPVHIAIQSKQRTVERIQQSYYEVPPGQKLESLARVLDMETPGPTIIFCRTRQATNDVAEALRLRGYGAEPLHGDMGQPERDKVLRRFREGQADILVATDVAARGLDIDTVTHVINYDIPFDVEQYVHRIGRTGRAGRTGDAMTLIERRERRQLQTIERMIGTSIKPAHLPTAADIAARRRAVFKETLRETLEANAFDGHLATVEELADEFDPAEIAAAALQMLWQSQQGNDTNIAQEIAADGEQPEPGMARLFIGIGRQDGLRPGDLVGAISNEAGISGRSIGAIDILDRTAFVEVPNAEADNVINALRQTKLRGKKVNVQIARPMDRHP
ncbi:DEAD/DEAH box helicase [Thermithiobacillus plumbiphilus]|uniref:RNA helicase n=1 Tax=Thermithiobacillus plumbiphilus TaxID=1729899 RepID=A0ABU9D738_9PROT